jgi:hypothetical protein
VLQVLPYFAMQYRFQAIFDYLLTKFNTASPHHYNIYPYWYHDFYSSQSLLSPSTSCSWLTFYTDDKLEFRLAIADFISSKPVLSELSEHRQIHDANHHLRRSSYSDGFWRHRDRLPTTGASSRLWCRRHRSRAWSSLSRSGIASKPLPFSYSNQIDPNYRTCYFIDHRIY